MNGCRTSPSACLLCSLLLCYQVGVGFAGSGGFNLQDTCGKWLKCAYATTENRNRVYAHVTLAESDPNDPRCGDPAYIYAVGLKNAKPTGKDQCSDPTLNDLIKHDAKCTPAIPGGLPACNYAAPLDRATTLVYGVPGGLSLFINLFVILHWLHPSASPEMQEKDNYKV